MSVVAQFVPLTLLSGGPNLVPSLLFAVLVLVLGIA